MTSGFCVSVPLGRRGLVAIVNEEDADRVLAHHWFARPAKTVRPNFYAVRKTSEGKWEFLHRFILNPPVGLGGDHLDGDGLHCTRRNMRVCTQAENLRNRTHAPAASALGHLPRFIFPVDGIAR